MDQTDENLLEVIKEELYRLGVQGSHSDSQFDFKKSIFYQNGSKLLGYAASKSKPKNGLFLDSPKGDKKLNIQLPDSSKTPKSDFNKIKNAKSPFLSKNKMERKSSRKKESLKKLEKPSNIVFGCDLENMELCSTYIEDGTVVSVPKFLVDACNLIRKNVEVEGIFRKAGSAQRQNEIKALLNSGLTLPTSVHPIDAACLLKQFLRQLPSPLLSHHVHFLMTKCLELPKMEQLEALSLCSLLLTKHNQDLLVYVLELLSCVASASQENLMDSHNLAIVLAPNLLPSSKGHSGKKGVWATDDMLLESTIDVIQLLIDGSGLICRLSEKVSIAVQNREKSQSVENLSDPPSSGNPKKKRRSASMHRIMNSIRRVVQGGPLLSQASATPASPLKSVSTTPYSRNGSSEISMEPDIELNRGEKTVKRKSDSFEPIHGREEKRFSLNPAELDRPKKKAKVELKSAKAESVLAKQEIHIKRKNGRNMVGSSKSSKSMVSIKEKKNSNIVKRRYSLRDKMERTPNLPSSVSEPEKITVVRRRSFVAVPIKKTPSRTSRQSPNSVTQIKSYSASPMQPLQSKRSRSFNATKHKKRVSEVSSLSVGRPYNDNRPVGSEQSSLGPRGIPDGAESNLRDSPVKSLCTNAIKDLEEKYDDIKSVVKLMEEKIEKENLNNLKDSYLPYQLSNEQKSVSCTQLVCDAYERMEKEMKDLDSSPADNLSRRLGRELKIRSRRSDEHRVLRSPSQRKIGSIRRRSKELEQNLAKLQLNDNQEPKTFTPKLKGVLLPSPQTGLRRGKPNSIKSGLPVVVKPLAPNKVSDLPSTFKQTTPAKTICIYKRRSSSGNSLSSDSIMTSMENLSGILSSNYSGPVTRRRSSLISSISNPLPSFNLPSDNSFDLSFKSLSGTKNKSSKRINFEKRTSLEAESKALNSLGKDPMEWVSATKFMREVKQGDAEGIRSTEEQSGNRPSIAALKEQKKVTANVQLFSQLQDRYGALSPSSRRSSRHRLTPDSHPSLRAVNSESHSSRKRIIVDRSPSTPVGIRPTSRSRRRNSNIRQIIISPLKESNFQSSESTPRIMGRDRRTSRVKRMDTFIVPSGLTPLPPRPFKPKHLQTPKGSTDTPPKLLQKSFNWSSKKPLSRNFR